MIIFREFSSHKRRENIEHAKKGQDPDTDRLPAVADGFTDVVEKVRQVSHSGSKFFFGHGTGTRNMMQLTLGWVAASMIVTGNISLKFMQNVWHRNVWEDLVIGAEWSVWVVVERFEIGIQPIRTMHPAGERQIWRCCAEVLLCPVFR